MLTDRPSQLIPELSEFLKLHPDLSFVLSATGRSMIPTIVRGDKIHVKKPTTPLRVGDIAVVKTHAGLFCIHRVSSINPHLITKGDGALEEDGPVDEVIALVDHIEKTWISRLRRFLLKLRGKY